MPWMIPTAVVGGSIISGLLGSNAAGNAANTQAAATTAAAEMQQASTAAQLAQQQNQFNTNQGNIMPWVSQGQTAGNTLGSLMGAGGSLSQSFNASDLGTNLSPSYNFMLQQGQQALAAQQSASGGIAGSGQNMKDAIAYNQNYASNGYQQAFNNYNTNQTNLYNRLQGISQLGENAAVGAGAQGAQVSSNMAQTAQTGTNATNNLLTTGAAAQAAGAAGSANAWSGAIGTGINSGLTMSYLNSLDSQQPGANLPYNQPYTPQQMTGFYNPITP